MKTDYKSIYKGKADDDLIVIAVLDKALFLPEALEAAREELISRGIDPDSQEALDAAEKISKHRDRFKEKKEEFRGAAKALWFNKVVAHPSIQNALESKRTSERCSISDNESVNAYQAAAVIIRAIGLFYLIPIIGFACSSVVMFFSEPTDFHDFISVALLSLFILCLSATVMLSPEWLARNLLFFNPKSPPMGDIKASPSLVREAFVLFGIYLAVTGCLNALDALAVYHGIKAPIVIQDMFYHSIHKIRETVAACIQCVGGLCIIFSAKMMVNGLSIVTPLFAAAIDPQAARVNKAAIKQSEITDDFQNDL
ncbi:hypothetical protein Dalk_5252 [Desulfatibacillum aliphaticivorans]|uniref:Uncharacterized protein n=1 Tax=Desulfatibacillum aliphaticivorans TaxID=218208 RepID=B8FEE1_DESAL|nr:hypothetical protein [Desulfatibacillum aliphaticivorans]ACL06922.1 hypothetical protein Dalk_5252 [Desulfatibacillum aliphaticivorans]